MVWLVASAAGCVCFCAVAFGTFVPLRDAAGIEYLYAWPGAARLAATSGAALLAITTLYGLVVSISTRHAPHRLDEVRAGAWLSPLAGLGVVTLGLLAAAPGIGAYGAPAAYAFYDLRWWWLAGLAGWSIVRADALVDAPIVSRLRHAMIDPRVSRQIVLEALLVAIVAAWAIATTPHLRFSAMLHGDEPKYLRYCEVWYQGGGADISQKRLFAEEPLDAPPRLLHAMAGVLSASAAETGALFRDLRKFAGDPRGFRWNRATGGNGFVRGKYGGVYEIYQPGLSAMLMPGYFVDRYLTALDVGYNGEFPGELPMTLVMMLLTYAACAVALFRLLRHALGDPALAWLWAAIGGVTLPTGAFAFQLYPELPAAVAILGVTTYVLFSRDTRSVTAGGSGVAAAGIAWLHPRFLVVSGCLFAIAMIRTRKAARYAFTIAFAAVLVSLLAYDYRITGSWLPTALWSVANPEGPLHVSSVPLNVLGYGLDWRWGLFPHAPLLFGLLPGLACLSRRQPRHALALVALALALVIPASAHTIHAAGGTPGRLVLAVVPLALWPVAVLVRAAWTFAAARLVAIASIVLSLDAAIAYNWSHEKAIGPMHDGSISGWKLNLAFPGIRHAIWNTSRANFELCLALIALVLIWTVVAFLFSTRRASASRPIRWWMMPAAAAVLAATATAATAVNGIWFSDDYLVQPEAAQRGAATALVTLNRCAICFTSRRAAIDWTKLEPNGARGLLVNVDVDNRQLTLRLDVATTDDVPGFGRVRVDYGDNTITGWSGIFAKTAFRHTYSRTGTYPVTAWLQLRDGSVRSERATVTVAPSPGD